VTAEPTEPPSQLPATTPSSQKRPGPSSQHNYSPQSPRSSLSQTPGDRVDQQQQPQPRQQQLPQPPQQCANAAQERPRGQRISTSTSEPLVTPTNLSVGGRPPPSGPVPGTTIPGNTIPATTSSSISSNQGRPHPAVAVASRVQSPEYPVAADYTYPSPVEGRSGAALPVMETQRHAGGGGEGGGVGFRRPRRSIETSRLQTSRTADECGREAKLRICMPS